MSKTIRLDPDVYDKLDAIRGKRDTFSEAVARLINIKEGLDHLIHVMEGNHAYQEWREKHPIEPPAAL